MPDNASGLGNCWKLQECGGEVSLPVLILFPRHLDGSEVRAGVAVPF